MGPDNLIYSPDEWGMHRTDFLSPPITDNILQPTIMATDLIQAMFRDFMIVYYQTNGEADPDHMEDPILMRIQKNMEELKFSDVGAR